MGIIYQPNDTGNTAGAGWTCPYCNQLVGFGQPHACEVSDKPPTTEQLIAEIEWLRAEVERLRAANQRLESYLNQIAGSAQEWDCNKLGGVNIQRKRWQRLGELARTALRR